MGYTRYWNRTDKALTEEFLAGVREVINDCKEKGIIIRDGYGEDEPIVGFNFCKTARKPYDYAVRKVLRIAELCGIVTDVRSDGKNNVIVSDEDYLNHNEDGYYYEEDDEDDRDYYNEAIEMLQDDELFTKVYESLDRELYCYNMDEIDSYYSSIRDFCNDITEDFNINDDYFYYSIYGLESTDYPIEVYRDDMDEDELLNRFIDYVMKHRDSIYYEYDNDFTDFMELIDNLIPQESKEGE